MNCRIYELVDVVEYLLVLLKGSKKLLPEDYARLMEKVDIARKEKLEICA